MSYVFIQLVLECLHFILRVYTRLSLSPMILVLIAMLFLFDNDSCLSKIS